MFPLAQTRAHTRHTNVHMQDMERISLNTPERCYAYVVILITKGKMSGRRPQQVKRRKSLLPEETQLASAMWLDRRSEIPSPVRWEVMTVKCTWRCFPDSDNVQTRRYRQHADTLSFLRCVNSLKYLSFYVSMHQSNCRSIYLFLKRSVCLSACPSVCLPIYLYNRMPICLNCTFRHATPSHSSFDSFQVLSNPWG